MLRATAQARVRPGSGSGFARPGARSGAGFAVCTGRRLRLASQTLADRLACAAVQQAGCQLQLLSSSADSCQLSAVSSSSFFLSLFFFLALGRVRPGRPPGQPLLLASQSQSSCQLFLARQRPSVSGHPAPTQCSSRFFKFIFFFFFQIFSIFSGSFFCRFSLAVFRNISSSIFYFFFFFCCPLSAICYFSLVRPPGQARATDQGWVRSSGLPLAAAICWRLCFALLCQARPAPARSDRPDQPASQPVCANFLLPFFRLRRPGQTGWFLVVAHQVLSFRSSSSDFAQTLSTISSPAPIHHQAPAPVTTVTTDRRYHRPTIAPPTDRHRHHHHHPSGTGPLPPTTTTHHHSRPGRPPGQARPGACQTAAARLLPLSRSGFQARPGCFARLCQACPSSSSGLIFAVLPWLCPSLLVPGLAPRPPSRLPDLPAAPGSRRRRLPPLAPPCHLLLLPTFCC